MMRHIKLKIAFTFLLMAATFLLFASFTDLIFDINKKADKWNHTFKLKGGKLFKIYFKVLTHAGEKKYNQKIYFETEIKKDDGGIHFQPPYLILNSDSSKSSITITTVNDIDDYLLMADGRASIDLSKHAGEKANGYALDNSPEKKYCDFNFVYPADTTLKCTVRVENIE